MIYEYPWISKILESILAILVIYLLAIFLRRIIRKTVTDPAAKYLVNKKIFYISLVVVVVIIAMIWAESLGSLTTMIGLLSAGLALALKDPISSLVGWFYISGSKIYQLGDRIEINGMKGDVVDISMANTTLVEIGNWVYGEQSTGRLVKFPNYWVFTKGVYNYTTAFPYVWAELAFVVTFESDWKKAVEIFQDVMNEVIGDLPDRMKSSLAHAQEKLLIHYKKYTPIVYLQLVDSGVRIVGRFPVMVRNRRGKESELTQKVLEKFEEEKNISLAYTTYRIVK